MNLLDTHTLIWFLEGDSQLSNRARFEIEREGVTNFISIASIWEMAIKVSLEKLELKIPFNQILQEISENGFEILPITFQDTLLICNLPFHHRDPFDRILIAQSQTNNFKLISKDQNFMAYPIDLIW